MSNFFFVGKQRPKVNKRKKVTQFDQFEIKQKISQYLTKYLLGPNDQHMRGAIEKLILDPFSKQRSNFSRPDPNFRYKPQSFSS